MQQEAILEAARSLEALNPTDSPATSPLINGRWSLLYQGGAVMVVSFRRNR
jgi:PAP_fibrillin